jgi:predicted transcriptional regulator
VNRPGYAGPGVSRAARREPCPFLPDLRVQIEGLTDEDRAFQKELAERLLVTKSNVCQIVRRMEERGLVSRRQEGRAKRLFLTEEGHRLFEEVVPSQEELIGRACSPVCCQKITTYSRKPSVG